MNINENREVEIKMTKEEYQTLYNAYCIIYSLRNELQQDVFNAWLQNTQPKTYQMDREKYENALNTLLFCLNNVTEE